MCIDSSYLGQYRRRSAHTHTAPRGGGVVRGTSPMTVERREIIGETQRVPHGRWTTGALSFYQGFLLVSNDKREEQERKREHEYKE